MLYYNIYIYRNQYKSTALHVYIHTQQLYMYIVDRVLTIEWGNCYIYSLFCIYNIIYSLWKKEGKENVSAAVERAFNICFLYVSYIFFCFPVVLPKKKKKHLNIYTKRKATSYFIYTSYPDTNAKIYYCIHIDKPEPYWLCFYWWATHTKYYKIIRVSAIIEYILYI